MNAEAQAGRSRAKARRRQILIGLGMLAVATLGMALYTGSWVWLSTSLIVDAVLAAYIALLLQVKQQSQAVATSVSEPVTQSEVRVVAG